MHYQNNNKNKLIFIIMSTPLKFRESNLTNNYKLFHFLKGNRYGGSMEQGVPTMEQIAKYNKKVKELIKSMDAEGYNPNFPIEIALIGAILYILDGQHRFQAAMMLGLEIPFVILPDITSIEEAEKYCKQRNNSKGSAWTTVELFYSAMNGIENPAMKPNYKIIEGLQAAYNVNLTTLCDLAIGEGSTKTKGIIKNNRSFTLKPDVELILETALAIAKNSTNAPLEFMSTRAFVRCIGRMVRHPEFDEFFYKRILNATIDFDYSQLKSDSYVLGKLEAALNYRLHTNRIYLTRKNFGAKLS